MKRLLRFDFGGPYDGMEVRAETLFGQIAREKRIQIDAEDDVELARRAGAIGEWHAELAEIFERAEELISQEDGHPFERVMAHSAAVFHKGQAHAQLRLGQQHMARAERHRKEGIRHALADPFARVHAAGRGR